MLETAAASDRTAQSDRVPGLPGGPPLGATRNLRNRATADGLEAPDLLGQRAFDRQALHRRRAVETVASLGVFQDEIRVGGLRDRPPMREDQNIGPRPQRRTRP